MIQPVVDANESMWMPATNSTIIETSVPAAATANAARPGARVQMAKRTSSASSTNRATMKSAITASPCSYAIFRYALSMLSAASPGSRCGTAEMSPVPSPKPSGCPRRSAKT